MNKKYFLWVQLVVILLSALMLTSCNRLKTTSQRVVDLNTQAREKGFSSYRMDTGKFVLQSFARDVSSRDVVDVYIEGDGLAWKRKKRLSNDPTPLDSLPFQLAMLSPHPTIYLARPCQYQTETELGDCHAKYWSSHRYAEEVVQSLSTVLNRYQEKNDIQKFRLIGYSGGGSLAVLLAAARDDVAAVMTIAANLDHDSWTEFHRVSPLTGSLNAYDVAADIASIPQWHFVGSKDKIIPLSITQRFIRKSGSKANIFLKVIDDFDHRCCWQKKWPEILSEVDRFSR